MAGYVRSTRFSGLNDTGQSISAGECRVTDIIVQNTSAAVAFVQVFDAAAANVTLGTTVPVFEILLALTTGFQHIPFGDPVHFTTRMSAFSTTTAGGNTGSGAGVTLQAWIL